MWRCSCGRSPNIPVCTRKRHCCSFLFNYSLARAVTHGHNELYCSYASCHGARPRKGCNVEGTEKGILHCLANFKSQAVRTCGFYQGLRGLNVVFYLEAVRSGREEGRQIKHTHSRERRSAGGARQGRD